MARHFIFTLLVAGVLTLACSQQYEAETSREWQPSRLQRTQISSPYVNTQSSPQIPRRGTRDRFNTQNSGTSGNSDFENVRTEKLSRERTVHRRIPSRAADISHMPTEIFNENIQERRPASRSKSNEESFEKSYESFQVDNEQRRPAYQQEAVQEISRRPISRPALQETQKSQREIFSENIQDRRPASRSKSNEESVEKSYENFQIGNEQRRPVYQQEVVQEITRRPISRPVPQETQKSHGETSRSRVGQRNGSTAQPVQRQRERTPSRITSRAPYNRERTLNNEGTVQTQNPRTPESNPENEVFKPQKSRSRFSISTSTNPPAFESVSTVRPTAFVLSTSTVVPLETAQVSNEEIGTEPTEKTARRQFQRPNRVSSIEETPPKSKFAPRTSPLSPRPASRSRQSSKEQTFPRIASKEETEEPSQENTFPTSTTTTSTTESPATVNDSRNKQQLPSRGRSRANAEKIIAPGSRPTSRGDKKAKLEAELKSGDDITEEDNYPKEFLEKILSSSEKNANLKTVAPKATNNRFGRARSLPAARPAVRPLPSSSTDSDVSESIHEDTFEQEVPQIFKAQEFPNFGKSRYFGKPKTFTPTTKITTTTSTIPPSTTKKLPKTSQSSSVDLLRQRYLDKLKQSQEERQQKLANLRPKLLKENSKPEFSSFEASEENKQTTAKPSTISFKPSSRFSRPTKNRYEPKLPPTGSSVDANNPVKFRPRVVKTTSKPDSAIEPATPTLAEHARTRNKYSRLRKEELSVETPIAKTSWSKNAFKPKREESAYNFIRLRTKDLTPLASEDVMESVVNNEVFDLPTTTSSTESSSSEVTTRASSAEMTTTKVEETVVTETPTSPPEEVVFTVTPISVDTTISFTTEPTSESSEKETPTILEQLTIAPERIGPTPTSSQQFTASTRHRFSSRYNGSIITTTVPETFSTEQTVEDETSSSTLSLTNLLTSSSDPPLSSSDAPLTSSRAVVLESSLPSTQPTTPTSVPTISSTEVATSTTVVPTTSTTTKKKPKKTITTTVRPGFLDNRPVLRNIIALFAPTTTTTKKPKTISKPKPKSKKPKAKPKSTTTTTTTTPSTTTETLTNSSSVVPLPLAISAEEVINTTQDLISNRTSTGSDFSKVPRDELDALTPLSLINTTEATTNENSTENLVPRLQASTSINDDMDNVTSQYIFFNSSSTSSSSTTSTSTTPSTTTSDYFVYGIYPNNTVVKKRAWKTFDYEKYMSPYVIFGIYPNNTIVRKFPNGTIINDEFMTSDNEIGDPSSTTSTSTTTTTEIPSSSPEPSTEPTTIPTDDDTNANEGTDSNDVTDGNDDNNNVNNDEDDDNSDSDSLKNDETTSESTSTEETTQLVSTEVAQSEISDSTSTPSSSSDASSFTTMSSLFDLSSMSESPATEEDDGIALKIGDFGTTPTTTSGNAEDTTLDPSLNQVLPLTIEEVQSLWTGNFTESLGSKNADSAFSSSFNIDKSANLIQNDKNVVSLKNLAFRSLSTVGSTMSTKPQETTTEEFTVSPELTTRKPRVKFVTLTPGVIMTTDMDDAITLSSQHVQKVTKAPSQIPDDLLTNVFGSLQQKASSPIPDILKDVGNEVEGDGLTAALARRIIALAMERAKSTTTEPFSTTVMSTSTESSTISPTITTTERVITTQIPQKTTKRKQSTRTTTKAQVDASQNTVLSLPVGTDLEGVLQRLIQAQNLEAASTQSSGVTTVKAPAELEKTVENQIRLAEEVRKASRTMKKKKKKVRTTTQPPPFNLGFLFNFFNRPSPAPTQSSRSAKKVKASTPSAQPDSQLLLLTSVPSALPSNQQSTLSDVEDFSDEDTSGNQNDPNTRGQLLTAAIDVTRAVSRFMGTVINNAAQSFQTFMRGGWGR